MIEHLGKVALGDEGSYEEAVNGDGGETGVSGKDVVDTDSDVQLREDVLHGEINGLTEASRQVRLACTGNHPVDVA